MAALQFAVVTSFRHRHRRLPVETLNPTKPVWSFCCFAASFPAKPARRKNHLRQKILKTLKKPPANPIITTTTDSPSLQEIEMCETILEIQEGEEYETSAHSAVSVKGNDSILTKYPIWKYGLWLFGAFVFQTVYANWIYVSAKDEILSETQVIEVGNGKIGVENSGIDSFETERKIEEIGLMAREARKKERIDSNTNDVKSRIKDEVDDGLVKLRNKLETARGKKAVVKKKEDAENKKEIDVEGALFFKKKYKFKYSSGHQIEKPKGFIGSDEDIDPNASEAVEALEITESTKNATKKVVAKPKAIDGIAREKNKGRLNSRKLNSRESRSKGKGFGGAKSGTSETDFWWLNLPYVLVIFMQRRDDGEGLYALESIDRISHVVAFEDRSDAFNFCYLLKSFFKDDENFQANVAPLTVKELVESMKSFGMRVVVVKRGQLKPYAGQPLTDAEMALRALIIKQN